MLAHVFARGFLCARAHNGGLAVIAAVFGDHNGFGLELRILRYGRHVFAFAADAGKAGSRDLLDKQRLRRRLMPQRFDYDVVTPRNRGDRSCHGCEDDYRTDLGKIFHNNSLS